MMCCTFIASHCEVLFSYLELKSDFQSDVFKMVAGILHLGNVVIQAVGSDQSLISVRNLRLSLEGMFFLFV